MRYMSYTPSGTYHLGKLPVDPKPGDVWVISPRTHYIWTGKWSKFR